MLHPRYRLCSSAPGCYPSSQDGRREGKLPSHSIVVASRRPLEIALLGVIVPRLICRTRGVRGHIIAPTRKPSKSLTIPFVLPLYLHDTPLFSRSFSMDYRFYVCYQTNMRSSARSVRLSSSIRFAHSACAFQSLAMRAYYGDLEMYNSCVQRGGCKERRHLRA